MMKLAQGELLRTTLTGFTVIGAYTSLLQSQIPKLNDAQMTILNTIFSHQLKRHSLLLRFIRLSEIMQFTLPST